MNNADKCFLAVVILVIIMVAILLCIASSFQDARNEFCKENGYEFGKGEHCYRAASTGLLERKAIVCINDGLSCNYEFVSDVVE